jgi:hypothetical protein
MQQAIQKSRQTGQGTLLGLKNHLKLIGSLAGELIALASLVAALVAGLAGLVMVLG